MEACKGGLHEFEGGIVENRFIREHYADGRKNIDERPCDEVPAGMSRSRCLQLRNWRVQFSIRLLVIHLRFEIQESLGGFRGILS